VPVVYLSVIGTGQFINHAAMPCFYTLNASTAVNDQTTKWMLRVLQQYTKKLLHLRSQSDAHWFYLTWI